MEVEPARQAGAPLDHSLPARRVDRGRGVAAVAEHLVGDALADAALRLRRGRQCVVGVRVHVNEPRCHGEPAQVDDPPGPDIERRPDCCDAAVPDRPVRRSPRSSRAIDQGPVANEQARPPRSRCPSDQACVALSLATVDLPRRSAECDRSSARRREGQSLDSGLSQCVRMAPPTCAIVPVRLSRCQDERVNDGLSPRHPKSERRVVPCQGTGPWTCQPCSGPLPTALPSVSTRGRPRTARCHGCRVPRRGRLRPAPLPAARLSPCGVLVRRPRTDG